MPRKEGGDERAAPCGAGQLAQDQEKQDDVGGVEEEIGQVMPARVEAIQRVIHRMRDPGQRMPIARVTGFEGPGQCGAGEAVLDGGIVNDVIRVIVVGEIEMGRRPIQRQSDHGKQQADQHGALFFRHGRILKEKC